MMTCSQEPEASRARLRCLQHLDSTGSLCLLGTRRHAVKPSVFSLKILPHVAVNCCRRGENSAPCRKHLGDMFAGEDQVSPIPDG